MLRVAVNDIVTGLDEDCIQPNAVDLRLDTMQRISTSKFTLSEFGKINRKCHEVNDRKGWFNFRNTNGTAFYKLRKGSYQFETNHHVTIPEGMAGWLIARSTLNRNGIFITSGLYDSGFNNIIGGVMHVMTGRAVIQRGARIAQFILVDAETAHLYDGQYNAPKS